MNFNLLFLPLLGGYGFVSKANFTKYKIKRLEGHHLLFYSARWGVILLLISFVLVTVIKKIFPSIAEIWHQYIPFEYTGAPILSFVLGNTCWLFTNMFYPEWKAVTKAIDTKSSALEILLKRAVTEVQEVSITMSNEKVYIGRVSQLPNPVQTDYIKILPIYSGYRDSKKQLVITTYYGEVIQKLGKEILDYSIEDLEIVIPLSEIMSANIFSQEAYKAFRLSDPAK